MIRNAAQYVASLRDNRSIYIDGKIVGDTTTHRAFRRTVASAAKFYDYQSDPANRDRMTFRTPDTGEIANRIWELPKSYEQLVQRRKALEEWISLNAGFIGRGPGHVASCISGMAMGLDVFKEYDPKRADAVMSYYRYARDNDLYLTYVIINPQADRSKAASEQENEFLTAGVVDQDGSGITVRGAKMLASAGILANEVFVTCIQPLRPGDERYAISFVIPLNAKGVKMLSRKSYEEHAPDVFDNPLASRFDENDAIIYFDDVKVPWDRVFVNQNIEMCQKQFHATPAHVYQNYQAQIRLSVKMRFLIGLARRIADTNGVTAFPQVREILGNLAAQGAMVDALLTAMEVKGSKHGEYFVPDRHTLYAAQVLTQQLYPQVTLTLRELAGGGLIALPSSVEDFRNPETRKLIERTQQSPTCNSLERVKLFRLAWDAVGSEFASRHLQYEMFYAGALFVTKNHSFATYDWARSAAAVDDMLKSYSLEGATGQAS